MVQYRHSFFGSGLIHFLSTSPVLPLTDIRIKSGRSETSFKAHRILLASVSPFFERVLNARDPMNQEPLVLEQLEHSMLAAVLRLVYEGFVDVPEDRNQEFCFAIRSMQIHLGGDVDAKVYGEGGQSYETPPPQVAFPPNPQVQMCPVPQQSYSTPPPVVQQPPSQQYNAGSNRSGGGLLPTPNQSPVQPPPRNQYQNPFQPPPKPAVPTPPRPQYNKQSMQNPFQAPVTAVPTPPRPQYDDKPNPFQPPMPVQQSSYQEPLPLPPPVPVIRSNPFQPSPTPVQAPKPVPALLNPFLPPQSEVPSLPLPLPVPITSTRQAASARKPKLQACVIPDPPALNLQGGGDTIRLDRDPAAPPIADRDPAAPKTRWDRDPSSSRKSSSSDSYRKRGGDRKSRTKTPPRSSSKSSSSTGRKKKENEVITIDDEDEVPKSKTRKSDSENFAPRSKRSTEKLTNNPFTKENDQPKFKWNPQKKQGPESLIWLELVHCFPTTEHAVNDKYRGYGLRRQEPKRYEQGDRIFLGMDNAEGAKKALNDIGKYEPDTILRVYSGVPPGVC